MKKLKCFFTRHEFMRVGVVDDHKVHYECERCGNNYVRNFNNGITYKLKPTEIELHRVLAKKYQEKFKQK